MKKILDQLEEPLPDFSSAEVLRASVTGVKNVVVPIENYRDEEKIHKLKQATAPFLLRRHKSDRAVIQDLFQKTVKNESGRQFFYNHLPPTRFFDC